MSLLRNALIALSVCSLVSGLQAQDTNYNTGLQTPVPASFMTHGHEQASSTTNCASSNANICDQSCYDKVGIFGDFLYMRMRNGDVPYALPVDGLGPQSLPTGNVGVVSPFYQQGFRVGAWIAPMELLTIRGQYLNWNSNSRDTISAPDGNIIRALTTHPSTDNAALDSLTASAEIDNELRIYDLDGLVRLVNCGPWTVQGVSGLRYAQLRQNFQANYTILGDTQVNTSSYFQGIGPRLGVESDCLIKGGLAAYGKGYVNFLLGDITTEYSQQNLFQGQLASTGFTETRLVTNLELELGFSYSCCCDHLRISAGYMISSWSNVVSTGSLVDSVQNNTFNQNRNNLRDTLIIDSLVARVELRF